MVTKVIIDKLTTLISAAFGLVAALAWNSAIQAIFKQYITGEGIWAKLAYAIIVTIIAVIAIIWIAKVAEKTNYLRSKASEKASYIRSRVRLSRFRKKPKNRG